MGCHNGQVCVRVCPKARLEKPRVRQTRFDFKKAPGNLCVGLRKSSVPSVVRSSSAAAFFTSQWYVRQTRVQFQHSPYSQATITVRLAIHKAPAYILITSTRHRVLSDITKKYYCWQTHAIKLWTKAQEIRGVTLGLMTCCAVNLLTSTPAVAGLAVEAKTGCHTVAVLDKVTPGQHKRRHCGPKTIVDWTAIATVVVNIQEAVYLPRLRFNSVQSEVPRNDLS